MHCMLDLRNVHSWAWVTDDLTLPAKFYKWFKVGHCTRRRAWASCPLFAPLFPFSLSCPALKMRVTSAGVKSRFVEGGGASQGGGDLAVRGRAMGGGLISATKSFSAWAQHAPYNDNPFIRTPMSLASLPSIMKYALELQGYGAPNGHTDTSAACLVLSA